MSVPAPVRFRNLAELAARQHGVVGRRQLLESGWSPDDIRRARRTGRLHAGQRGSYVMPGAPHGPLQDLFAICTASPLVVVSHRSAWWMYDHGSEPPPPPEVTAPRWQRRTGDGFIVHESLDIIGEDVQLVDGLPCTRPERTLIDLGAVLPVALLERYLDEALATKLVTLDELERVHRRVARRGRDGVGVIRPLLEERADRLGGVANHFESQVSKLLVAHGIERPVHQHPVDLGGVVVRLDLAWPSARVCLECDGLRWHTGAGQLRWDDRRQNGLVLAGWTVLRTTYAEYKASSTRLVATVRHALDDRNRAETA